MKRPASVPIARAIGVWSLALACVAGHAAESSSFVRRSPTGPVVSGAARVIVRFADDSSGAHALSVSAAKAGQRARLLSVQMKLPQLQDGRAIDDHTQVLTATGMTSEALAERVKTLTGIVSVEVDGRKRALSVPNDPLYPASAQTSPASGQWYLRPPDATTPASIDAQTAWDTTTGSAGIVVAVLDTGIRPNHPDLAGKLESGYDFIHDIGTANDGDARDADPSDPGDAVSAADVSGPDAVDGCSNSDIGPSSWHGTQTASLIGAATNNGAGMASVGRDVRLLPVRVLGKCGGYDSDIQAAMRWAAGLAVSGVPANPSPAKVINMSLGSSGACTAQYQAVVDELTAAGVVVVAAAGNDGLAIGSPANCNGVVAVTGLRHIGTKVGFSDLGPNATVAAPGGNCVNDTGACLYPLLAASDSGASSPAGSIYTGDGSNGTSPSVGTSFSSPLVAGTVALMFSVNSSLTPTQVIAELKASARAFPSTGAGTGVATCQAPSATAQTSECYCTASTCGAGMLDARAAVALAAGNASGGGGGGSVTPSGGGGGGAVDPIWLIGLLVASLALRSPSLWRRIRRSPSRAPRS